MPSICLTLNLHNLFPKNTLFRILRKHLYWILLLLDFLEFCASFIFAVLHFRGYWPRFLVYPSQHQLRQRRFFNSDGISKMKYQSIHQNYANEGHKKDYEWNLGDLHQSEGSICTTARLLLHQGHDSQTFYKMFVGEVNTHLIDIRRAWQIYHNIISKKPHHRWPSFG